MKFSTILTASALLFTLSVNASADSSDNSTHPSPSNSSSHQNDHVLGLSGDAAYFTYGMDEVNNRFLNGSNGSIHGGMGYGGAVKLGLTENLAAKVGIDYLFASTDTKRVVGPNTYNSRVELPATMIFIGGEYVFLPLSIVNVKLIGGYTLVNIFNGHEHSNNGLDLGNVTGTGSGFQAGLGVEVFLARGFSVEADLAYNYAKINNATFAGSPAVPGSTDTNGSVDYSGLMAKAAFTIYLIP